MKQEKLVLVVLSLVVMLCLFAHPSHASVGSKFVITFLPDSSYVHAEDNDAVADPSGQDGMELGAFSWNQGSGAFSSQPAVVDTNGQWGLSSCSGNTCSGASATLTVSGNTISNGSDLSLARLTSSTNPLVGSWGGRTPGSTTNQAVVITFVDDTHFVFAQSSPADAVGHSGIEMGTYSWNRTTGAFTATTIIDTNGEWGFSHTRFNSVTVSGDTMTLNTSDGPFTVNRVTSATNPIVGAWVPSAGDWACVSSMNTRS